MGFSKMRIDGLDENITARELCEAFGVFGEVREVSIHRGANLLYALVTMPSENAKEAYLCIEDHELRIRGRSLRVTFANRSRDRWLSHDWRPPG